MSQFTTARTVDASAWDAFVSSRSAGHFMQSHAWGEFQRELGWDVTYCTVGDAASPIGAAPHLPKCQAR